MNICWMGRWISYAGIQSLHYLNTIVTSGVSILLILLNLKLGVDKKYCINSLRFMDHKIVELSGFNEDIKLLHFWRSIKFFETKEKRITLEIPNAK